MFWLFKTWYFATLKCLLQCLSLGEGNNWENWEKNSTTYFSPRLRWWSKIWCWVCGTGILCWCFASWLRWDTKGQDGRRFVYLLSKLTSWQQIIQTFDCTSMGFFLQIFMCLFLFDQFLQSRLQNKHNCCFLGFTWCVFSWCVFTWEASAAFPCFPRKTFPQYWQS